MASVSLTILLSTGKWTPLPSVVSTIEWPYSLATIRNSVQDCGGTQATQGEICIRDLSPIVNCYGVLKENLGFSCQTSTDDGIKSLGKQGGSDFMVRVEGLDIL